MGELGRLTKALVELNEEQVTALVHERLAAGEDPLAIVKECNEAMVEVGKLFEKKEYYLSELIMSGEIMKSVMSILEPRLGDAKTGVSEGTVVIGTVKEDIHDIGKNIVISLLKGTGFEVVDLGVDVASADFVAKVRETGAKVLGLSTLLNFTYPEMKKVVDDLSSAGLRDKVKVVIGGAPCNERVRQFVGADYYAPDAVAGVNICKEVYGTR